MARYRLMSAIVVNIAGGSELPAGSVVTEGVQLPGGFLPNGACEPLDADATNKFWAAGPITPTIDLFVPPPATYWAAVAGTLSPNRLYKLTGPLAAGLTSKLGIS
jgi:hypothetical protein